MRQVMTTFAVTAAGAGGGHCTNGGGAAHVWTLKGRSMSFNRGGLFSVWVEGHLQTQRRKSAGRGSLRRLNLRLKFLFAL